MNIDPTLRDKLKNMPHIEPRTSRETLRRHVLAEVEKRERQPRKPRKILLPAAFAGAVAVFMFMVLSPWIMQKAGDSGLEVGRSESELGTMSGESPDKGVPVPDEETADPSAGDKELNEGETASDMEQGKADHGQQPPSESVSEAIEDNDGAQIGMAQATVIESKGQVTREINVEGMKDQAVFDRYVLQPHGLQILIPVMPNGEKWFGEPQIDEGANQSVVFRSNAETMENGELLISSITVTAYDDQSPADVVEAQVVTEEENAKELGYPVDFREEKLPNGERLMFFRTLQDANGNKYGYVRETFITEQNGRTFAFHIGRNETTNEGWGPRLTEVVYPELKVLNQ